jgi:hypothetical protein
MKFTWEGLLLAPLPVPFIYGVLFVLSTESRSPLLGILVLFALGSIVSYGATAFLFLPCLYLASKFTALTARVTCAVGATLGAIACLAYLRIAYQASGDDSGPPAGTFAEYLGRQWSDPFVWIFGILFIAGGLLTAALYWRLADRPLQRA